MKTSSQSTATNSQLSPQLKNSLMLIGRGLGTFSVYGSEHPSAIQMVSRIFEGLQDALKDRDAISIGSFKDSLTVDDEPVAASEAPIRTLEKRLVAMRISHLSLSAGLSEAELKQLLTALSAASDSDMKEALAQGNLEHVKFEDVQYVALREGEEKTGKGKGKGDDPVEIPPAQVSQIVAFLKGQSGSQETTDALKKALSDPEKLAQMIMEAAAIRQTGADVQSGESLADIVLGCLRRTFSDLREEKEFRSVRGKTSLNKAMLLLEKTVLEKIHKALGEAHPDIDERIFNAIREMEEEREFERLTAHYFSQREKMGTAENKVVDAIRKADAETARARLECSEIAPKDWQRLLVQAGAESPGGGTLPGLDMSSLAVVLEKIEDLMQMDSMNPLQVRSEIEEAQSRLQTYTDQIEMRVQELEGLIRPSNAEEPTIEHHADTYSRGELMQEVANLALALIQPLTVINGSVEAAIHRMGDETQKEFLDLAHVGGKRMQALTKRLMLLVGCPMLEDSQDYFNGQMPE